MSEIEKFLLAAALNSREHNSTIVSLTGTQSFSEQGQLVCNMISEYYAKDSAADDVTRELLANRLSKLFPSPKQNEALVQYFKSIPEKVSSANVVNLCYEIRKRAAGMQLADALLSNDSKVYQLLDEYKQLRESAEAEHTKTQIGFDEIFSDQYSKIPFRPDRLCQTVRGGLRPTNSLLVFGRPGAAKTLLVTNIAASYAAQGYKVLHLINEEAAEAVALRYLSLMASGKDNKGPTLDDMSHFDEDKAKDSVKAALERANKAGYANVHIIHGITSLPHVQSVIERMQPTVLVLDQVRNISAGGDGLTQNLEIVTRALRNFANKYSLIGIGVSQAGAEAEGKPLLRLTDLDSSKTGAQGACDLMLGIGVTTDLRQQGKRWVSVVRNKISGVVEDFPISVDEQHTKIL